MASEGVTEDVPPENMFNILIASDIHLGYAEKVPLRGEDSFTTFEEILSLAKENNVDMVLLGGDLFHDSKPSMQCYHRCISLLRKYCMGDRPIPVEFLSDQADNFKHCSNPVVNYEDPNINVSIPVYSIHGNHDDPSGGGRVSALDVLSATGLVNYFGKWVDLTHVEVSPLLMRKGPTRLALYGLGYLKDERLSRLFSNYSVKMFRPREFQDEWFNIFMLHQNREDRGPKNFIEEEYLPEFLDLIIWGHEHKCCILPEWNESRRFFVTQPGSPVATSLCDGEAVQKHVALLNIYKKQFKITPIPLKTVRPFVFDTLILRDCTIDFSGEKPSDEVQEYIAEHMETLINRAVTQISGDPRQPQLPLIRLRVEYSEEKEMFNGIRFGNRYTARVANPSDVILFRKQRATDNKLKTGGKVDKSIMDILFNADDRQSGAWSRRVETVVERYFAEEEPNQQLQILSIKGLAESATRFIDKDDKDAFDYLVNHQMKKVEEYLIAKDLTEEEIDQAIEAFKQERLARAEDEARDARQVLDNPKRQKKSVKKQTEDTFTDTDSDDPTGGDFNYPDNMDDRNGVNTRGRGRGRETTSARARSRGPRARGGTTSRGRGRKEPVVQTTITDTMKRQSLRTSSRRVVIFDDSDD